MRAVVTGASSGIGLEISKVLNKMGYDITLVARRKNRLESVAESLVGDTKIIVADLAQRDEVYRVFDESYTEDTEILINNAGFGLCGEFLKTDLKRELEMIDTNVVALHILTKLFAAKFAEKNRGYILNVASIAAFLPGPLLATYYSTKAYVRVLTESVRAEMRELGRDVFVGALCPGPVKTEFDDVANVRFSLKGANASDVAEYAVKKMMKKKLFAFPTFSTRSAVFFSRFVPACILSKITYRMQRKKLDSK